MWALFTAALTRASSTTRVSIVNVSSNFVVTALLGWVVFGERLPLLWWGGAGLLAAGNVVIGRREEGGEGKKERGSVGLERREGSDQDAARRRDGGSEGVPLMEGELQDGGDMIDLDEDLVVEESTREAVKKGEEVDAPIR